MILPDIPEAELGSAKGCIISHKRLMIGLGANLADLDIASEFFELFKTPWELAVPGRRYDVILCTDGCLDRYDAEVFLVYGSGPNAFDGQAGIAIDPVDGVVEVVWGRTTFPLYGRAGLFEAGGPGVTLKVSGKAVDRRYTVDGRAVWRLGYDLFAEVRYLLTQGQPADQALIPTLDLHIQLLRHVLVESKVSFLEIPPRPHGYDYICCLTHDVDFFGIKRQRFDRTMAGFLWRASIGTMVDLVRGRRSFAEACRNWRAFCSLPLVFLDILPDFWRPFDDYAEVEKGIGSTFFVVPFKGKSGVAPDGSSHAWRAVPYSVDDVKTEVRQAVNRGYELAVHGIDAWRDPVAGRAEKGALQSLTSQQAVGIRMHWLYFDADSPRQLEEAGFDYDSTWGYNETVGYRAGTSQVFRFLTSERLMELPLTIMDSALFSWSRMNLDHREGLRLCAEIIAHTRQCGGTVVINWHERSLAPERLWGRAYKGLLEMIRRDDRVWFATAAEAVDWFRWRRSITFRCEPSSGGGSVVQVLVPCPGSLSAALCINRPMTREVEAIPLDGLSSIHFDLPIGSGNRS